MKNIDVQPIRNKKQLKEFLELLETSSKHGERNRLLFEIGLNTGLKVSDLVKLKTTDVFDHNSLTIYDKSGRFRSVPLNSALKMLKRYQAIHKEKYEGSKWLFPRSTNLDEYLTEKAYYKIIHQCGEYLGMNYIGTNTIRKTFGYHFYMQTKDIVQLMDILNYSSQKKTLQYIGLSEEATRASLKDFKLF